MASQLTVAALLSALPPVGDAAPVRWGPSSARDLGPASSSHRRGEPRHRASATTPQRHTGDYNPGIGNIGNANLGNGADRRNANRQRNAGFFNFANRNDGNTNFARKCRLP